MGAGCRTGWVRGRCLGRGSTAAVYLAASTSHERREPFAVKSAELSRSAPLQREEKMLSSLSTPHVVSCLGSDVTTDPDGRALYNLFLEYVPGGSLADAVPRRGGALDERATRLYTRGILRGLAYLHSVGIAHCDVKPHNVLLVGDDDGTVKLADLGCARWVDDGGDGQKVVGGTPLYMAPEVARGEEQGPPADIWALGCTVMEMATGCPPWRDVSDPVAAVHRIAFSDQVPEFPCSISDDVRDFLGRCLNRDPTKRWSAEELLNHPLVTNCGATSCFSDCKRRRASPNSTLDQVFWDSWQDLNEDDEAERHVDNRHSLEEAAQQRLLQLLGRGSSLPPAAISTWNQSCCWITIRNGQHSECPTGQDEPSTTASLPAGDGTIRGESSSSSSSSSDYSDHTVAPTGSHLPTNSPLPSWVTDVNRILLPPTALFVVEGDGLAGTPACSSSCFTQREVLSNNDYNFHICHHMPLLLQQEASWSDKFCYVTYTLGSCVFFLLVLLLLSFLVSHLCLKF